MMGAELDPCSTFLLYHDPTLLFFPHAPRKGPTPHTKVRDLASPEGCNGQTPGLNFPPASSTENAPASTPRIFPKGRNSLLVSGGPLTGWWAVGVEHKGRRKGSFLHVRTTPLLPPPRSRVTLYVTVIKGAVHKPEKPNGPVCRCHLYHKATGAFISTVRWCREHACLLLP